MSVSRRGFSFIEILVASVILMIALLPLYGILTRSTQGISANISEIEAVNAATCVLEALQSVPEDLFVPFVGPVADLPSGVADVLRPLPLRRGMEIVVDIKGERVRGVVAPPGWDDPSKGNLERLCRLWCVSVTCRYSVKASGESVTSTRGRSITLSTIIANASQE